MLLDSVAHFMTFNLKAASVTRQLIPKMTMIVVLCFRTQERRISLFFGGIDAHLVFVAEWVYCCDNNIELLKTKKFSLNLKHYFSNFIIVSQNV